VVEREDSRDQMTLHCEVAVPADGLEAAIAASLRAATSLRGAVRLVAAGSLANDGKVIEDRRPPS
jgi:phenylacetate-CoA ligase